MSRLKEIEVRMSEIKKELESEDSDINKLNDEVNSLIEERGAILKEKENRKVLIKKISEDGIGIDLGVGIENRDNVFNAASPEYRSAFLKSIRGIELGQMEKRAMTTVANSAGAVVPTSTSNKILEKVKQYAPLLDKIDLLQVKGNLIIPAEGTTVDAALHNEGAAITPDNDTINKISLNGYEVTKLITISKSVETMSIDVFEEWLVRKLSKKIAEKLTGFILTGTGVSQPQGIDAISWNNKNSVTVGKDEKLEASDVRAVVGLLNGGYDMGSEWVMSKTTFFNDFHPLMDASANNIITQSAGVYYVCGYPVTFDDRVKADEAFLGNFLEGYVGNLQENINITSQFVTRENSYDFLGCAIFDGKVSAAEAFVKIIKAAA
jgi:HK97 family phage major capsid protein